MCDYLHHNQITWDYAKIVKVESYYYFGEIVSFYKKIR